MPSSSYLPEGFEKLGACRAYRRKVQATLRLHGKKIQETRPKLGKCRQDDPCHLGECALCNRRLRKLLGRFLAHEQLHQRHWLFVTIFVGGCTKPPRDYSPFGPLRDRAEIKAFVGRLRRLGHPDLLSFGSIETFYKTVANVPVGKPFHLHFMISGASKAEITEAARSSFKLDRSTARPLDIREVRPGRTSFVRSASYAFKQPFWKKAYPTQSSRSGRSNSPSRTNLPN